MALRNGARTKANGATRYRPITDLANEAGTPLAHILSLKAHGIVEAVRVDGEWLVDEISFNRVARHAERPPHRVVAPSIVVVAWFLGAAGIGGVSAWVIAHGEVFNGGNGAAALVLDSFQYVLAQ